eukprot:4696228-Amphidinium_carterae.2
MMPTVVIDHSLLTKLGTSLSCPSANCHAFTDGTKCLPRYVLKKVLNTANCPLRISFSPHTGIPIVSKKSLTTPG